MDDLRKTFYPNPEPYIGIFRALVGLFGLVLIVGTVYGQLKTGRFPVYRDLALLVAISGGAFLACVAFTYGGSKLFPVHLGPSGIKCYNRMGLYRVARWSEIEAAEVDYIQGIPYIFVTTAGKKDPLTVPIWLSDFPGFSVAVKEYAGENNPLSRLLAEA